MEVRLYWVVAHLPASVTVEVKDACLMHELCEILMNL